MVPTSAQRPPLTLSLVASTLAAIASVIGLLRTELYAPFTAPRLMPGTVSMDLFTLACGVGVPLAARAAARGSQRGWILWAGQVVFLFYCYALYAFEGIYSVLFPLYVAILGTSVYATAMFARAIDLREVVPLRRGAARGVAVYCGVLAVCFLLAWGGLMVGAIRAGARPPVSTVIVLDLALFMPAFAVATRGLWRSAPSASLLAPVLLVVAVGTCGSTLLGELLSPLWGFPMSPPMVALFTAFGPGSAIVAGWALASPAQARAPAAAA